MAADGGEDGGGICDDIFPRDEDDDRWCERLEYREQVDSPLDEYEDGQTLPK